MEGLQKAFRSIAEDSSKLVLTSPSSSSSSSSSLGGGRRGSASLSADKSSILITRPPRPLWMYSKIAAVSFIAGVVVGFVLNRRIRRWAGRLLKKIRDD